MPVIISVLLFLSGLLGMYLGQRIIKTHYDFFFRQAQPEDIVVDQAVFVCGNDGSYHRKVISNILTFGNDWKAFETNDGCRYVLGECFVKEEGQNSSISKETKGKWVSREDLNQYEKTFGKSIKQLENNTGNK
jgi:hypothetical protein